MTSYSEYTNLYSLLVKACPSARDIFSPRNQTLPPARLAAAFSNHLLEKYRAGHVEEFPSLAIQIEEFYRLADKTARDWATLGLLESIMTVWERTEIDPVHFRRYLRSQSAKDWDRLARFWAETKSSEL